MIAVLQLVLCWRKYEHDAWDADFDLRGNCWRIGGRDGWIMEMTRVGAFVSFLFIYCVEGLNRWWDDG